MTANLGEIGALFSAIAIGLTFFVAPTLFIWWRNDRKISLTQAYHRYVAYVMMAMGVLALVWVVILIGAALFHLVRFHAMPSESKDLFLTTIFLFSIGCFGLYSGLRIRGKTLSVTGSKILYCDSRYTS